MIDVYQKTAHQKGKCEDYVANNDRVIVLSDGCSSSKDTHLGAMLYAEIGLDYFKIKYGEMDQSDWRTLAYMASNIFGKRNSSYSYLDATVMTLKETSDHISVNVSGDGLIFFKKKDSDVPEFIKIDYTQNAPLYPSYLLDPHRMKVFMESRNTNQLSKSMYKDGYFDVDIGEYNKFTFMQFPKEQYSYIGISSDGVFDFRKNGEVIDPQIVFDYITGFKGNGKFLTRRLNHMFKSFEKDKIFPHDDFSIGVWKNDNI